MRWPRTRSGRRSPAPTAPGRRTPSACSSRPASARSSGIDAGNVPEGDDVEVVHSTAIAPDNPERLAARERGLPDRPRADLFGEIAATRRVIAVAGAHGKTTTAAMIAVALRQRGSTPPGSSAARCATPGTNAGWSDGEWLVVEADESDRSLCARAEIAVVTNVELDHHPTYHRARSSTTRSARSCGAQARAAPSCSDRPELLALASGSRCSRSTGRRDVHTARSRASTTIATPRRRSWHAARRRRPPTRP